MGDYYEKKDLDDFENIGEYAPELGSRYFDYYGEAMKGGSLTEREKALIALAVADLIFVIVASVKVSQGQPFSYPLTIKFIK